MISYDQKINKLFYYWLVLSFLLVFIMIIVGGLTRLTDSGLSITEWELFKGILPPLNANDWNTYFSLYKNIPQYKLMYNNMTIEEFKVIFYWEYFHRILGRILGLFFLIPLIYFYFTNRINKKYFIYCLSILFLIVLQGIIGWYMVKSGLVDNITVSHYRLSLHLSLAFIIISIIFWTLINLRNKSIKKFFNNKKKNYIFYFLFVLIFFQIIIGAFVSGLDAGKIYQTWPLMNGSYYPNDYDINKFGDLFSFSNHSLVQFYHRNVAYLIFAYITMIGLLLVFKKINIPIKHFLILTFILFFQVILGILTLVSGLNIYFASMHQICSLLLVLSVINLYYHYIN